MPPQSASGKVRPPSTTYSNKSPSGNEGPPSTTYTSDRGTIKGTTQARAFPPRTEYVLVEPRGAARHLAGNAGQRVSVPKGVPQFLGNMRLVGYAWLVAMIIVGFDEWHNNRILPRPSRLWYTSVVFGLLSLAGMIDILVPLVNALAIGYVFVLLWQYYQSTGQFAANKREGS